MKVSSAFSIADPKKGTIEVGGWPMPYFVGPTTDNPKESELIGIVKPKSKPVIITVMVYSKPDKPVDMEAVEDFLGTIKSF